MTACRSLGAKPIKIKPYTPRTNGKVEQFIQDSSFRKLAYKQEVTSPQPS
jgi:transposase InsO family protein